MANKIPSAKTSQYNAKAMVTWDNTPESFAKASSEYNKGLAVSQPLYKSSAAISNRFQGIDNNTSVRDSFSDMDYDFFRSSEQVPKHFRDIIAACLGAYQKVPIIRQIIDLMGDFASEGIKLVHPNESVERFYQEWFKTVKGHDRSERILNILYRAGNVIIKRADAKLSPDAAVEWKRVVADTDLDHDPGPPPGKFEVPYRYTMINPLIVEVLGEHVAAFTGKVHYVLKLPSTFYNTISLPLTTFDPSILTADMPRDLQQAMNNNEQYLLLDSDKLVLLFYKKDDWDVWAYPMLYSLLDEIILLQKMKMADRSALDGVISHIRVWKLGSMEHKIFPTDAAVAKLSNILLNHLAGGAMDLVWGPDLELTQTNTDIANFLGSEKYEFCMNTIHSGLGVPAAIGRNKGSMTDNFMSIRVLIERLKYGRRVLTHFWEGEIRRVQQAMGFRYPARVTYSNMDLSDEVAEKSLWIKLAEQQIVPISAVQERFGRIPEIDNILLMRERKARDEGKMPAMVSPYHDAQPDLALTKIGMQRGMITPSELPPKFDLDLQVPKGHDQDKLESLFPEPAPPATNSTAKPSSSKPKGKKGVSGEGRPKQSRDKKKRDQRTPKPYSKAEEFLFNVEYANKLQYCISEVVDPFFGDDLSKDKTLEKGLFKLHLLMNIPLKAVISKETIQAVVESEWDVPDYKDDYIKLCKSFREHKDEDLTSEELQTVRSYIYALAVGV